MIRIDRIIRENYKHLNPLISGWSADSRSKWNTLDTCGIHNNPQVQNPRWHSANSLSQPWWPERRFWNKIQLRQRRTRTRQRDKQNLRDHNSIKVLQDRARNQHRH